MRRTLWLAALIGTLLPFSSCQEEDLFPTDYTSNNGLISFLIDPQAEEQVETKSETDYEELSSQDIVLISQNGDSLLLSTKITEFPTSFQETEMPLTRGIPATDSSLAALYGTDAKNGIGILSFWSESATAPFIQNDYLKYDSNGKTANEKWIANAGPYYWPKTGSLDFWAWAPNTIDATKYNVTRTFSNTGIVNGGKIAFSYNLGSGSDNDAKKQPDLIFSKVSGATTNPVAYHMDHALSGVRFKLLSSDEITVTKISLENVTKSGSCIYNPAGTDKFTWTPDNEKGTYSQTFEKTIPGSEETATEVSQDADGTIFMMIPQALTATGQKVSITFKYTGKDNPETYTGFLYIDAVKKWEAGHIYEYTLKINDRVTVEVTDNMSATTKSNIITKNTGNTTVYLRAAVTAAWYSDVDGMVIKPFTVSSLTLGTNWIDGGDGYYYYKYPVKSGKQTKNALFNTYTAPAAPITGTHLEMQILLQGVKFDSEKVKVTSAWGETIASNLENTPETPAN